MTQGVPPLIYVYYTDTNFLQILDLNLLMNKEQTERKIKRKNYNRKTEIFTYDDFKYYDLKEVKLEKIILEFK